ncbi:MAG: hypothetical protein ACK5YZ_01230, partial [bacterium]
VRTTKRAPINWPFSSFIGPLCNRADALLSLLLLSSEYPIYQGIAWKSGSRAGSMDHFDELRGYSCGHEKCARGLTRL